MALSLVLEAVARLRRVQAPQLPGLRLPQAGARGLIGLAALLFVAAPLTAQATTASADAAAAHATLGTSTAGGTDQAAPTKHDVEDVTKQEHHAAQDDPSHRQAGGEPVGDRRGAPRRRVALQGDRRAQPRPARRPPELPRARLGPRAPRAPTAGHRRTTTPCSPATPSASIAQEQLGDADRYLEIYHASTGITQPGGVHLTDPDVIDVGWTLNIPGAHAEPRGSPRRGSRARTSPTGPRTRRRAQPVDPPAENETPVTPETEVPRDRCARASQQPQAEEPTAPAADVDQVDDADDSILDAPWVLAGLTGGGVLLSGALLMALQTRRRAGFRNRPPGRAIAAPPPELAPVEMTLNATGAAAAATVEFADEALRRLAAAVGAQGTTMPPLAAVELGHGKLTLHLSAPAAVPAPWVGSPDQTHWHVSTDIDADDLGPDTGYVEPPYPLLVTIGMSDTGETWLLNCEELSTLTISGDPTYGRDFARHLAAQLAVNPWSRRVQLDCIGVAEETVAMDERISYHPTGAAGSPATAEILAAAVTTVDRATRHDTDVSTARTGSVDDDVWPARMLLLDAAAGDPERPRAAAAAGQRPRRAVRHLHRRRRRTPQHPRRRPAHDEHRPRRPRARRPQPHRRRPHQRRGPRLRPGLRTERDRRGRPRSRRRDRHRRLGGLHRPVRRTAPRVHPAAQHPRGRRRRAALLPPRGRRRGLHPRERDRAGGPRRRWRRRCPRTSAAEVEKSDPTLDQDIADWFSTDCDRPRLSLLGPVTARTHGKALAKRKPYFTELLAYLALHRKHGATREEIGEAFGITAGKVRDYTNTVRDWLGTNPTHWRAPPAPRRQGPRHQGQRGVNVYQVDDGLLVDLDLFLRLRKRGQARGGAEGVADLCTALELVGEATAVQPTCATRDGPGSPTATGSTS